MSSNIINYSITYLAAKETHTTRLLNGDSRIQVFPADTQKSGEEKDNHAKQMQLQTSLWEGYLEYKITTTLKAVLVKIVRKKNQRL